MREHWNYLKYVLRHKWYVLSGCIKLGIPWRGIIHDLSKFYPSEWTPYVHFFYGDKKDKAAFDGAWLYHQNRNKHHWQFWMLRDEEQCVPMPDVYVREMVADWYGAGMAQGKPEINAWYQSNKDKMVMHSETRAVVDILLRKFA